MLSWFVHLGIVAKLGFALGLTGIVISAIDIALQPEHFRVLLVRSFPRLGVALKVAVVFAAVSLALGIVTALQRERLAPLSIVVGIQLMLRAESRVRTRRRQPPTG